MIAMSLIFSYLFFMTNLQKGLYSLVGLAATSSSGFAFDLWQNEVDPKLKGTESTLDVAANNIIGNLMMFLAFLAVAYGIWGGFQIITAWGDEEKVKKGRTILIQVSIGLVVIFIANSLVQFVIGTVLSGV